MESRIIKNLGRKYPTPKSKQKRTYLLVSCPNCDKEYEVEQYSFFKGKSTQCKSCKGTTHNQSRTRIYSIWQHMKNRCYGGDERCKKYYKNISVCKEWLNDFSNFRNWAINNGYEDSLTIDRKDNNGNYEPDNCRWVVQKIQTSNTRVLYSHNTSGYRGVVKSKDKYAAQISVNNKKIHIGRFSDPLEAAYKRDLYIIENNLPHTNNFKRIKI